MTANKVVKINMLDSKSIQNAMWELERIKRKTETFAEDLVRKLADRGVDIASYHFENAVYAGTNDVSIGVSFDKNGKSARILASGQSVLFIEFGTGVYKESAPEEIMNIKSGSVLEHGEYGMGKANNPKGWVYVGSTGQNPPGDTKMVGDKGTVRTMGNDANSSLWETRKALARIVGDVAREVWNA